MWDYLIRICHSFLWPVCEIKKFTFETFYRLQVYAKSTMISRIIYCLIYSNWYVTSYMSAIVLLLICCHVNTWAICSFHGGKWVIKKQSYGYMSWALLCIHTWWLLCTSLLGGPCNNANVMQSNLPKRSLPLRSYLY